MLVTSLLVCGFGWLFNFDDKLASEQLLINCLSSILYKLLDLLFIGGVSCKYIVPLIFEYTEVTICVKQIQLILPSCHTVFNIVQYGSTNFIWGWIIQCNAVLRMGELFCQYLLIFSFIFITIIVQLPEELFIRHCSYNLIIIMHLI